MDSHHIKLQSTAGAFDASFHAQLPALEQAMTANGIDPGDFVISKDAARGPLLTIYYRPNGNPFEYTVFVGKQSFTVTQPDDASFLAYLMACASKNRNPMRRIRWPMRSTARNTKSAR